ncbi:preprotein translocase subunit SecA [Aminobacterium sp. MB27-C1]|uniref:preprotein translocase subunit SecA n=1 Tax=Aminobacterium sp. MB27-C1 TaxID=3070661 RepID=UPI0027DAF584|nr:preprotein translocase subunit SecA [Aminobacterium sp. MB27-C1]WMI72031.1 preprotein translocase subunit SecA [Aminobacterium sp. MB27-C1]
MFNGLKRVLGLDPNERALKRYRQIVDDINELEAEMTARSDDELRSLVTDYKERLNNGESPDDLLKEVFALVREVSRRTLGLRHFDVQLMGGIALHEGKITEMKTGEGKTLVATLAVVLNALSGQGVHVITVNDYLARRDAEWMGPIYHFLGLSVGVIYAYMDQEERKKAYLSDVTYGTNSEFGFDYLRDNMAVSQEQLVQRPHHFCIVDEVDSILIDEARTPLIISGPSEDNVEMYNTADQIARQLKEGPDFEKDEKERNVSITEEGIAKCEKLLKMPGLFSDAAHSDLAHRIVQAIKAHVLFQKDVHYVIKDGEIVIVDEFTGRLMFGRRYSDGLHQAIEAKEKVKVGRESQTLATITLQNYFRMYQKLAGMTGTAITEAEEFKEIYGLEVILVPTNKPMVRKDLPDVIYRTSLEKFHAVAEEVAETYEQKQPVLVGTTSIENSEHISKLLKARKIPHQVLNAKYHEREAQIVAQAGRAGAITVATNMAGRGTDIVLGGNPEFLAKETLRKEGDENAQNTKHYEELLEEYRNICAEERDQVLKSGGLKIIGTERHESRRIDNQLRGRAGRQGDPGSSRFYLSLEDDLLRLFGSDRIHGLMEKLGMEEGEAIEHNLLTKAIESAQKKVEQMHFDIRRQLLAYDNVMNQQREAVYGERRQILTDKDIIEHTWEVIQGVIGDVLDHYFPEDGEAESERAASKLKSIFGPGLDSFLKDVDSRRLLPEASEQIKQEVENRFRIKIKNLGSAISDELMRFIVLHTLDSSWKDHLLAMDELRRGIGLRAIGQKDPLLEYQFESYNLFQAMMERVRESIAELAFRVTVVSEETRRTPDRRNLRESRDFTLPFPSEEVPGAQVGAEKPQPIRKGPKVGRNDPCPCGSGKKYKHCCGKNA